MIVAGGLNEYGGLDTVELLDLSASHVWISGMYRHGHPNVDFSKFLSIFG